MQPDEDTVAVFSPDGEVVTLLFSNMVVNAFSGDARPRSKSMSIELPVNSGSTAVKIEQLLEGYVWSYGGARSVLTLQQGKRQRRKVWPRESDEYIRGILRGTVRTTPSLSTTLSIKVEQDSASDDAGLEIDMMEIKLLPSHRAGLESRG
jgi:hypothetical protein